MTVKKRISHIVGLTKDIVRTTETTSNTRATALATTSDEITNLWKADYGRALRAILSKSEVREISAEGKRKAWPHLNEGLAVFGFYLGKDSGLEKRPLICLNGAHHPAALAAAFLHEVGHHVTADLFSTRNDMVQLSRQTGYEAHLGDARELAADVLVSLGTYPRNMAARLFDAAPVRKTVAERSESPAARKAVLGLARRYGLELENLPIQKRLQYQAGLIHFTRLRQALLEEYGF